MKTEKDFELKGLTEVMQNLNKAYLKIEGRSMEGMIHAGIHVRRDMEKTAPRIPVDKGVLRASFFITTSRTLNDQYPGKKPKGKYGDDHTMVVQQSRALLSNSPYPVMAMGFSANYAIYVHENLDADFARPIRVGGKLKSRRPGAGAKFFEEALRRNKREMLEIIANKAKI